MYGIDWDGPLSTDTMPEQVDVPQVGAPLTDSDFSQLCQTISPLSPSTNYGIDLYMATLQFVLLHARS